MANPERPPAGVTYQGHLDFVGCTQICGWVRAHGTPSPTVEIEIVVDGQLVATLPANEFRKDLVDAGIGDGKYGFVCRDLPWLRDGFVHTVTVRVKGTDFGFGNQPRQIRCKNDITEPMPASVTNRISDLVQAQRRPRAARASYTPATMKVNIVCYEALDDWILGKIATRLRDALAAMGMNVAIGDRPDPSAQINHHIIYWGYVDQRQTPETVMITHIDSQRELNKVRQQLVDLDVDMGVCISFEAVHRLAHFGIPRHKLCYVNPAHDEAIRPRKLCVGITARVYPDGCKREHLVSELADVISPHDFKFVIMGADWSPIVDAIRAKGFEVDYHEAFDHQLYLQLIPGLDFYFYPGNDEGSMGTIDALAAGVPTIVTPQGFHLDARDGITHPYRDFDELQGVFQGIAKARAARVDAVAGWTWKEYARKHALIWDYLLTRRAGRMVSLPLNEALEEMAVLTAP